MATQINEQKMIEENIFLHEQRLKSPLRRFIDKSFIPADYYHINTAKSTVDRGWQDVSEILGDNSPFQYMKIENFPLYEMDQIVLQLNSDENVLDNTYEGSAVIMADTIVPLQNDFFMLPILKDPYIFRVTGVENDALVSAKTYKIQFVLEYIDREKEVQLTTQTRNEFSCVLENIGTSDRCIIEKDSYQKLQKIESLYQEICDTYMTFFYSERYNCFLGNFTGGHRIYDPFQREFIMKHQLFKMRGHLDSLILTDQFTDFKRKIKYEKTIYRFMERRDPVEATNFMFTLFAGTNNTSTAFYRWLDRAVQIVNIGTDMEKGTYFQVLNDEQVSVLRNNEETENIALKFINQYLHDTDMDIYDIPLDLNDYLLHLEDADTEVFFFVPLVLYVMKKLMNDFMESNKNSGIVIDG